MSGFVGRRFGRKRPFIILLVLASLTWLLIAYPVSPLMMIIGRAVQGFFSGFMLVVGQIYTAEIAHKSVS
jgi:MFS family permease